MTKTASAEMLEPLEWRTERHRVNDLIPMTENPRKISEAKLAKLIESLQRFNLVDLPVVDFDLTLVSGHQRLKAMQAIGWGEQDIEVRIPNRPLTKTELKEYNLLANSHFGEWDADLLEEFTQDVDLAQWGMDWEDFHLAEEEKEVKKLEAVEDNYEIPDVIHTDIVPGDLFEFRKRDLCHRLLCGDSTDSDAVARLMGGEKANLCFTSPPYWVGKDYEYQKSEKEIDDFIGAISNVICLNVSVDFGRVVINTGTASINRIDKKRKVEILPLIDKWQKNLKQHGWLMRHLRIWAKRGQLPASISPKTDVIDQHNEYIAEFENLEYQNEFSQMPTFWNQAGEQRGQEMIKTKWAQQGLWDDVHGAKSAGGTHTAAFPVEIPARIIKLYSKIEEVLFEPFLGSGTTMVAAHQLNRHCYGMELDPQYCQVIVDRMKKLDPEIEVFRNGERME